MTINQQIEVLLEQLKKQSNSLKFGNIDFIICDGSIIRVDIRNSIKPDAKPIHIPGNERGCLTE